MFPILGNVRRTKRLMKNVITYILILFSIVAFSQQDKVEEKKLKKQQDKALNYIADANDLALADDFVEAEMEYRKALSVQPKQVVGAYNLGHQYYNKGDFEEALYRNQQALKNATTKTQKHSAFHNIGNILMQKKKCKEAVEAFKNALRNNPADNETRYNLGLAKECAKNEQEPPQEDDKDGDNNKDKDEDKDNKDNNEKEQEDKDKEEEGDKDKKEGDKDQDDKGDPKDEKDQDKKEGDEKNEQKQPQPGQMSPQQIKNLLEAMENQEQKVQEKINAEKVKGVKVQTDKDW